MRNLRLEIEYDGTGYCGWQIQKNHQVRRSLPRLRLRLLSVAGHQLKSIQEVIEKTLQKILQEKVMIIASGRTDAGVHALGQVANFRTKSVIETAKLKRALNGILPKDIKVSKIEEVGPDFHSRFSAKSKVYRYSVLNRDYPPVLLRNRVYYFPYPLNLRLMRKEAKALLGRHNFKSFQASDKKERDAVRSIKIIKIIKIKKDKDLLNFEIEADGFLYNMVRNIVGTLLEIGRGRFPPASAARILKTKDRRLAGPTLPACGLCLLKVKY
jgi:tRNA pseudouridine38-40 synthase